MSRRFIPVSLLAILAVVLAACAAPTAAPAGEAAADGVVEMEYWFSGTAIQIEYMQAAVDEYNEMQDAVQITMVETPPSRERIATALASGEGPDLLWNGHNVPWYFGIEAVYPLNDFVADTEIGIDPAQLFPAAREAVQYGGVVQALPIMHCPGALFYNRGIFTEAGLTDEDAPGTWEEVQALAEQLTVKDGDDVTRWGIINHNKDWMLQEINLSNGGDWVNDDLTAYVSHPDNLVQGLEWWSGLFNDQIMPMPTGVTWAGIEALQQGSEAFVRGDAAMSGFSGLCHAAGYLDSNPDLDIGAVLTPLGPSAGGVRTISPGFNGLFVMADAADPREGYLFIKWFFENKALDFVLNSPGNIPSTTAALDNPTFQESPIYGFGSVLEDMQVAELRTFHVFPGRLDVRSAEPGMAEKVLLGESSAQEAVDEFLQHAQEVFELYSPDLDEFRDAHQINW